MVVPFDPHDDVNGRHVMLATVSASGGVVSCSLRRYLFVRWLRQRNVIVQIAICGLTIPAVTALLLAIVRLFGLDQ